MSRWDSGRGRLRWRDVRPVFLKSAGAVGLAGIIVALISNESLFNSAESLRLDSSFAARQAEEFAAAPPSLPAAASQPTTAEFTLRAGAFSHTSVGVGQNSAGAAPLAAEQDSGSVSLAAPAPVPEVETAALPAARAELIRMTAADQPTTQLAPRSSAPAEIAPPETEPAAIESPQTTPSQPTRTASLWPDHALDCPRDWVAVSGSERSGEAPADCREAIPPLPEVAALTNDDPALNEAASQRASELAALQMVPRIPVARPDPPPAPRKAASKARANWPSDPPPKCGSKRAKWRYVSKVPTWYCR